MTTGNLLEQRTGNSFYIKEHDDRYVLSNVPHPHYEGLVVMDWSKALLDGGNIHSQDNWVSLLKNHEFQLPSAVDCHATVKALNQHQEEKQKTLVGKVRTVLRIDFRTWMITGSLVQYNPVAPDNIIHNYGTDRERSIEVNLVGPDLWITDSCGLEEHMEALLGTRNLKEIKDEYKSFNDNKPYLLRFNSRPVQTTKRDVVLGINVYGSRFNIDAVGGFGHPKPARGVVVHGLNKEQTKITNPK